MDLDPVILSRIQFAFVVSLHILFPAFTIGLAAIAGMRLATGYAGPFLRADGRRQR